MLRELDHRENDGISVTLSVETDGMIPVISLRDSRDNLELNFTVPDDRALDAFRHPFAYASTAAPCNVEA